MPSWTCSLCETEKNWPTKDGVRDHIRNNHMDTLIAASMKRAEDDPNQELDVDVAEM
jgi:hypothetical protein